MTIALTCQSCRIYFLAGPRYKSIVEFRHEESQVIPLGSKGRIDKFVYEVMGFAVKQESKYNYRWREYLLFSPYQGFAFLSEYNGHWNFIWPIENSPKASARNTEFEYDGSTYKLYQKYGATVVYANGEFFFDVVDITSSTLNYEFIAPPNLLALEQSEDSVLWCAGEHISRKQIGKIFSLSRNKLPSSTGIGYTQPFDSTFSDKALISLSIFVLLLVFLIQVVLNNSSNDRVIFQEDYSQAALQDQKMFVTPPFNLDDGTKSLGIYVFAPLSNDWFFSEFSLINENTGTEYNFTKEVEYYSGYDEGAWTEGSQSGEAFLSRIPPGSYHINIYPEFSGTNNSFTLTIKRDVPMSSNFYVTCIALAAFPVFYFLRKRYREQKRWSDSDYSPYNTQ